MSSKFLQIFPEFVSTDTKCTPEIFYSLFDLSKYVITEHTVTTDDGYNLGLFHVS
jgi:hypothetical protein